jgi:hypothetical protein
MATNENLPGMASAVQRIAMGTREDALRGLEHQLKELTKYVGGEKPLRHLTRAYWLCKGLLRMEGEE